MKNVIFLFLLLCLSVVLQAQEYNIQSEKVDKSVPSLDRIYSIDGEGYTTFNRNRDEFEICKQKFGEEEASCVKIKGYSELKEERFHFISIHTGSFDKPRVYFAKKIEEAYKYYYCELDVNDSSLGELVFIGQLEIFKNKKIVFLDRNMISISQNDEYVCFIFNYNKKKKGGNKADVWLSIYNTKTEEFKSSVIQVDYLDLNDQSYFVSNTGEIIKTSLDSYIIKNIVFNIHEDSTEILAEHEASFLTDKTTIDIKRDKNFSFYHLSNNYNMEDRKKGVVFTQTDYNKGGFLETKIESNDSILQSTRNDHFLYLYDVYTTDNDNTYVIFQTSKLVDYGPTIFLFGRIVDNEVKILFKKEIKKGLPYSLASIYELNNKAIFMYGNKKADNYLFDSNYGKICLYAVDEISNEVKEVIVEDEFSESKFIGKIKSITSSYDHRLLVMYFDSGSRFRHLIFISPSDIEKVMRM